MQKIILKKGNGLTSPQSQPAKTQTKRTTNFIAKVKEFASGFYLQKGIDVACMVGPALLLLVAVFIALPHGFFDGLDWAGLVALGGVTGSFAGTDNPRHLRVIQALMTRPLTREQLDDVAGCSNGPELVAELRRRGLELECTRTKKKDRDLFDCFPGVYHFTQQDRRRVIQWITKRNSEGAKNA